MEQNAHLPEDNSPDNTNDKKIERNKNDKKVTLISYKNLNNEELCEPFYYNEEEFKKKKKSMRYSNLQSLINRNSIINNMQRKKSLINFENIDNKNKNLKVFDGNKMELYLNRNNNNNYYLNRKYSSLIFNRFHKINKTIEESYNETIANKWYFCTKINVKKEDNIIKEGNDPKDKKEKRKIKSKSPNKNLKKNSEHKSIKLKKITNKNSTSNKKEDKNQKSNKIVLNKIKFNDRFKNFPTDIQNKTRNVFRKKDPKKNESRSRNKTSESNQINSKTFYPKLPKLFSKKSVKKEKDNTSSNSSSFSRQRKNNYIFYQVNPKKIKNKKNIEISNTKQPGKKYNLKLIYNKKNKKSRGKNELLLPKINDKINNNTKTNINIKKRKKNKSNFNLTQEFIKEKNSIGKTIISNDKNKILVNKSMVNIKKQKKDNSPSYHIMNYNHKDVENNFIKYDIHYSNDILYPKYQLPSINIKTNKTKNTNIQNLPELKLHLNSSINKYNSDILEENIKTPLQKQNEYSRNIKRRFFRSFKTKNKPIIIKRMNISKNEDIMLQRFTSSLLAIKEYFNIK